MQESLCPDVQTLTNEKWAYIMKLNDIWKVWKVIAEDTVFQQYDRLIDRNLMPTKFTTKWLTKKMVRSLTTMGPLKLCFENNGYQV